MSRAYIYKVVVHIKHVSQLGGNRSLLIEEDRPYYFSTSLAAKDFGDSVMDVYDWKYSFSAVPMFEDSRHGIDDATLCFSEDVESLIRSVPPITVAA